MTNILNTPVSEVAIAHQPCPDCGSTDARATYEDGHSYCFSCEAYSSPTLPVSGLYTYEFLPWRSVLLSTMSFYGVKTRVDNLGKPHSLVYTYPNKNPKYRLVDKKEFFAEKGKPLEGLFGQDKFTAGGSDCVIITEGELDALSLWQVLRKPVVSVTSASAAVRDCTLSRSYLNSFERIYLAFDGDTPGQDAIRSVSRLFDYSKVYVLKFSSRKDANEYLQAGEEDQLRMLFLNAKKYLPDNIKSTLNEFKELLVSPQMGQPYPFKGLTDMTYGIRTGETVLFTAQEKVGKTELMHFIEHKLLKETENNVGAIYLEEPESRHLQALAGIEIKRPCHLPNSGIEDATVFSALSQVVKKDGRLHILANFGSRDADVLLDEIRFLVSCCGCKYVILDHLTMVVSGTSEVDERRALDYISTKLEMLVKELNFALVCVSHVNDQGQTRGSRYPTKVFDITVQATRDLQHPDLAERNTIYLRVLFNRYCGKTGPAGKVRFIPENYSFEEEEELCQLQS